MPFFSHDSISFFYTIHSPNPPPTSTTPPILLIHGYACDSHDFSHQIPYLTSLNLCVIALDHRGHGRSTTPTSITSSSYSMRTFASDVLALLDHLKLEKVVLIGHSMGTVIASILAAEHPEIIAGVVYAHPIYSGTAPALAAMSTRLQSDPTGAPDLVAGFFEKVMYTPTTPAWLKCFHIRRVLGTDPGALAGCVSGIVELFDKIIGQSDEAKTFMKKRRGPRLVVCTNSLPGVEAWEREIGVDAEGGDEMAVLSEGTFSHVVCSEEFNELVGKWLVKNGFAVQ